MGARIVGTFEDLDVSATVSPFQRPDLGPWLDDKQRGSEWDVIIWSKIDRGFRDPGDAVDVARWCEKRQRVMVLVDDGITLDFRPEADPMLRMMAEMFLLMGSMFAKWELRRFQSRTRDAHSVLRHTDRIATATPDGFMSIPHPSGKGRGLAQDPARQAVLHQIAKFLVDEGKSFNWITNWLNAEGVETHRDYRRAPDKKRGDKWIINQTIRLMETPATQGWKTGPRQDKNRDVPTLRLDEMGNPIKMAEPTFTPERWQEIQTAVAMRRLGTNVRTYGTSPLLGVAVCGLCDSNASRKSYTRTKPDGEEVTYAYYACAARPGPPCAGVSMKDAKAEALLQQTFLEKRGERRVKVRIFVPGADHTEELDRTIRIIDQLRGDREMGLIVGEQDERRYRDQMRALLARRTELEKEPYRAAGYRLEETDQTYADVWAKSDTEGRRKLLIDAGVTFKIYSTDVWEILIDEKKAQEGLGNFAEPEELGAAEQVVESDTTS